MAGCHSSCTGRSGCRPAIARGRTNGHALMAGIPVHATCLQRREAVPLTPQCCMKFEGQLQPGRALVEAPWRMGRAGTAAVRACQCLADRLANSVWALRPGCRILPTPALKEDRPDAVGYWPAILLMVWLSLRIVLAGLRVGGCRLVRPPAGYVDWLAPLSLCAAGIPDVAAHWRRWLCLLWLAWPGGCNDRRPRLSAGRRADDLWSDQRLGFHLNRPWASASRWRVSDPAGRQCTIHW